LVLRLAVLLFAICTPLPAAAQGPSESNGWLLASGDIRIGLNRACMLPELDLYPFRHAVDLVLVSDRKLSGIVAPFEEDNFVLLTGLANDPITVAIAEVRAMRLRNVLTPEESRLSQTQVVRRSFPRDAKRGVTVITNDGKKYRGAVLKIGVLTVSLELEKTREQVLLPYDQIKKANANRTVWEKVSGSIPVISK
jgi:hypothetical protein